MKRISVTVLALVSLLLFWYLFLKPQDYQVSFKAKAIPGTIYETVKAWNKTMDTTIPVDYESLNRFEQTIISNDSVILYEWNVTPIHDSLSQVKVNIKDLDHSLVNKIKIPFSDTDFEKGSRKTLLDFNEFLNEHLNNIKVTILGEDELFSTFCACVSLETPQAEKASGMMANYSFLSSILVENEVQVNGPPFIEVVDWNLEADRLSYNFCYPIIRSEKLPNHPNIHYKRIFAKRALKAVYNGNYVSSDRAWYALLEYAKKNNVPVEEKPIEVFFNNPNMGGNELLWKTEVYMPLKESE
ncbi:AraC family transcriptional regulator [Flagellimonas alvinocaridis]|uniref:AraC family transcriptional regulator n=1 Tax=Flagellimonas alvinocaridis TaxID=2530200 RepID=A0A4S8RUQ0_9FLAO|nr:GyrI-like domain-containing protein [Allomuricauda alvinocaridis]THV61621.1 AraC family transcriptional regulator [Allomuricauda alvinocaridis]